jgi:hypothetical protein
MNMIKFNFRAPAETPKRKLFLQINSFSFASFQVPIRFRQPLTMPASSLIMRSRVELSAQRR